MKNYLLLALLAAGFTAKAESVLVTCEPIYFKNAASISAVINVEKQDDGTMKTAANIKAIVKLQNNSSTEQTLSEDNMNGHIVETNGLPDGQGHANKFRTFFGAASGDIVQAKLSFGTAVGPTANSYLVAKNGVYYFAKCSQVSQ